MIPMVGLDLSLNSTGVAEADGTTRRIRPGDLKGAARLDCTKGAARLDYIAMEVQRSIQKAVVVDPYVHVAIEGYAYNAGHNAHQVGELGGVIRLMLFRMGIPFVDVTPSQVKKFATGNGSASKYDVRRAAEVRLGLQVESDDEADAAWLRAIGLHLLGQDVVALPKSNQAALRLFAPDPFIRNPRVKVPT